MPERLDIRIATAVIFSFYLSLLTECPQSYAELHSNGDYCLFLHVDIYFDFIVFQIPANLFVFVSESEFY